MPSVKRKEEERSQLPVPGSKMYHHHHRYISPLHIPHVMGETWGGLDKIRRVEGTNFLTLEINLLHFG